MRADPQPVDEGRVKRLEAVARVMDDAVEIPLLGFRVGIDPLLGLLPGAGDVIGATFSGWMVVTAARMGATPSTLLRMLLNLGLDALVGGVPVLGDLFDIAFKANRRNLKIVQDQVVDPDRVGRRSRTVVAVTVAGTVIAVVALIVGLAWAVALVWGAVWGMMGV